MIRTNKRKVAEAAKEAHRDATAAGTAPASRPRLTDRQLVVLTAAAGREDRVIALPETLKGKACDTFVQALVRRGLAMERPAGHSQPAWRHDEATGISMSLIATTAGLAAIGVDDVDAGPTAEPVSSSAAPDAEGELGAANAEPAGSALPAQTLAAVPSLTSRPGSKQARLIAMLSEEDGCSISEAAAALGWLTHTTRAALTGLRRKGYTIERMKDADGAGSRHRIIATAPTAAAA